MSAIAQLELRSVTKRFGGVAAVDGVNFTVEKGEIVGIIGPNGAGKTTLLNCISGVYRLDGGDIRWQGASIAGMAPHRVASLGIGHFIWYPKGRRGPFDESFPKLVSFISNRGAKLPTFFLGAGAGHAWTQSRS